MIIYVIVQCLLFISGAIKAHLSLWFLFAIVHPVIYTLSFYCNKIIIEILEYSCKFYAHVNLQWKETICIQLFRKSEEKKFGTWIKINNFISQQISVHLNRIPAGM